MNIYLNELRNARKVTLLWTAALAAVLVFFLAIYPAFYRDAKVVTEIFAGFPPEVLRAVGTSLSTIASLPGFYSFVATYVILCGGIQAMQLGTTVLAREAAGKTADFLLTKPVSRARVLTAKLLAALTALVCTNLIYLAVTFAMAAAVRTESVDWGVFLLLVLALPLVQLIFLAVGFLVAAAAPKIKSVLPLTLGTVFGFFFVGMLGSAIDDNTMRYFTPFRYFEPTRIIEQGAYEARFLVLGGVIVAAAVAAAYLIYTKKDIHTA